jgi:hypothetical protein
VMDRDASLTSALLTHTYASARPASSSPELHLPRRSRLPRALLFVSLSTPLDWTHVSTAVGSQRVCQRSGTVDSRFICWSARCFGRAKQSGGAFPFGEMRAPSKRHHLRCCRFRYTLRIVWNIRRAAASRIAGQSTEIDLRRPNVPSRRVKRSQWSTRANRTKAQVGRPSDDAKRLGAMPP